jgi:hypothetical protein
VNLAQIADFVAGLHGFASGWRPVDLITALLSPA